MHTARADSALRSLARYSLPLAARLVPILLRRADLRAVLVLALCLHENIELDSSELVPWLVLVLVSSPLFL